MVVVRFLLLLLLTATLVAARCGDGVVDEGEYCDTGMPFNPDNCCTTDCLAPLYSGGEEFDEILWVLPLCGFDYIYPQMIGIPSFLYIENMLLLDGRVNASFVYSSEGLDLDEVNEQLTVESYPTPMPYISNTTFLPGYFILELTFVFCPETSPASDLHMYRAVAFSCCGDGVIQDYSTFPSLFTNFLNFDWAYEILPATVIVEECDLGQNVNGQTEACTSNCRLPDGIVENVPTLGFECNTYISGEDLFLPGQDNAIYSNIFIANTSWTAPDFGVSVELFNEGYWSVLLSPAYGALTITFGFAFGNETYYVERTVYSVGCLVNDAPECVQGSAAINFDGQGTLDTCCVDAVPFFMQYGDTNLITMCVDTPAVYDTTSVNLREYFGDWAMSLVSSNPWWTGLAWFSIDSQTAERYINWQWDGVMNPNEDLSYIEMILYDCWNGTRPFILYVKASTQCCGNGVIDIDEECDLGEDNGVQGSCCSSECTLNPVDEENGCLRIANTTVDVCAEVEDCLLSDNGTLPLDVCEAVVMCANETNTTSQCVCDPPPKTHNMVTATIVASIVSSTVIAIVVSLAISYMTAGTSAAVAPALASAASSPIAPPTFIEASMKRPFRFSAKDAQRRV